jgi:nicotinamidase-related amidase
MIDTQPTLILLDCQQDQIRPDDSAAIETVSRIRRLLVTGRNSGWRILHCQFKSRGVPVDPRSNASAPISALKPLSSEVVFARSALSAYAESAFGRAIAVSNGSPCFLVGFSAQFSLLATVFDSLAMGHSLTVVPQAVGGSPIGPRSASTVRDVTFDLIERLTPTLGWTEVLDSWTPQADPQMFRRMGIG